MTASRFLILFFVCAGSLVQPVSAAAAVDLFIVDSGAHGSQVTNIANETLSALGATGVTVRLIDLPQKDNGAVAGEEIVKGIREAISLGAEVINLSIGRECDCPISPLWQGALDDAREAGVPIIYAAGNDVAVSDPVVRDPAVIAVGGLSKVSRTASDFSWCVWSGEYYGSTPETAVDFYAAPGPSLQDAPGRGTSYAAPRIAAHVAALLADGGPKSKASIVQSLGATENVSEATDGRIVFASGATLFGKGTRVGFDDPDTSAQEYMTCIKPVAATPEEPSPAVAVAASDEGDRIVVTGSNKKASKCPENFNVLPEDACTLPGLLKILLTAVVSIGSMLLVLALVWVGFLFIKAQGSEEELRSARSALVWTVFGGLLLLGAQALSMVIQATVQSL